MSERTHEHWHEELSAYLLGALGPAEAAELESHLAACDACRTQLDWLRPAAQVLPESVERLDPPRQLRDRIMAEVQAESPDSRSRRAATSSPGALWHRVLGRRRLPLRAVAGFAAIALIAAGIGTYAARDGGPDSRTTTVVAGEETGVTGRMVREGDSGVLRLVNVAELPADKVLQAWVRRGKRIESAGALFVPDSSGTAIAVIDDLRGVEAVMITAEPRGGSDFPTSDPMISIPMPQ